MDRIYKTLWEQLEAVVLHGKRPYTQKELYQIMLSLKMAQQLSQESRKLIKVGKLQVNWEGGNRWVRY